ncbi:Protein N-acetyltransferase, RimJ/RimL family [Geodermatophilus saharensis]|uniref:Protein N-acetyltransferase, RimJ/RimL family n=1 Tax=Geodermatophilus saharensis TaxID=1137994 RepID=A0A239JAA9_9ACTN|nr:GNAT family N-acetyltransferase [Geodermatophilus saharensis]SNT01594.1 Protein N-acetyltransferase, RimJ/RimL family [Geodermatophilus saharensis]
MDPVALDVGALHLRPWREDDVDEVLAVQQDEAIRRWSGGVTTRDGAVALLQRLAGQPGRISWAVTDAATGRLLGSVSVHSVNGVQGTAQIGYWVAAAARGRSVAPRAVDAACRWAFATVPLERVELYHAVENTASGRVARKAGFTLEGRLRSSYRYGDGLRHDELLWGRLAGDPAPDLPVPGVPR